MLLLHQVGSVKIGEVVRYTVTYTPSHDRILPSPEFLYLRIRNTCAIALRAAFVHGPYTLSVAAYPSNFNPNEKFANPRRYGVPEFEPMLKAGGSWTCHLVVPDDIRQSAGTGSHGYFGNGPEHDNESVTWVIEVASQVIFSASAGVNYEVCLARDEKSLNLSSGIPVVGNQAQIPQPGRVSDFQQSLGAKDGHHPAQPKGVFSRAIHVKVEDTAALWNTPELPGWDEGSKQRGAPHRAGAAVQTAPQVRKSKDSSRVPKKQKKVHLVVLTHGLHSNLGADLLFLKESIDAGVKQAKIDAKARRAKERAARQEKNSTKEPGTTGKDPSTTDEPQKVTDDDEEDEDEEVIVRGFAGNATRTERGIKYLGKRLARYILSMTYPDQPFLPATKVASDAFSRVMHDQAAEGKPSHKHSTIHKAPEDGVIHSCSRAYKITKISFIAHSLGGLVQTYAIAYIQKHSPQFFDLIQPINFITLASPFLGLNHENPMYVSFALDFGLVGRTGQDLGLTWRAPTIARSGWGAIVSSLGENAHKRVMGEVQPESKPLLRILPTGPAHIALKKFRNRTVYSNVVNDGIVPLRTSCLLFLDWQGLGRVEKARREAGLVETVVGFGWAELTGANVTSPRPSPWTPSEEKEPETETGTTTPTGHEDSHEVPQPETDATLEDDRQSLRAVATSFKPGADSQEGGSSQDPNSTASTNNPNPFSGIFNFFRSNDSPKTPPPPSQKQKKIYQRSQTLPMENNSSGNNSSSQASKVTSGHELSEDSDSGLSAPPRTTFFESAGDLLNPKLPSIDYLVDPSKRPRTIFHDRVYHPSDIPPPPLKKRPTGSLAIRRRSYARTTSSSSKKTDDSGSSSPYPSPGVNHEDSMASTRDYDDTKHTNPDKDPDEVIDTSSMKVEEKIARAYHKGLSWRKVLVKLEPDAHNNLIVRRMFANAFGWPVVKHLVDAHFSDSAAARTRDDEETNKEMARDINEPPDSTGSETKAQTEGRPHTTHGERESSGTTGNNDTLRPRTTEESRTASEAREAEDQVPDLPVTPRADSEDKQLHSSVPPHHASRPTHERLDSMTWSDRDWADSADESEIEEDLAYGRKSHEEDDSSQKESPSNKGKAPDRTSSPLSNAWDNWTEKIVGKGASSRAKSPMSPTGREALGDDA